MVVGRENGLSPWLLSRQIGFVSVVMSVKTFLRLNVHRDAVGYGDTRKKLRHLVSLNGVKEKGAWAVKPGFDRQTPS
jgi:hypothetical protein